MQVSVKNQLQQGTETALSGHSGDAINNVSTAAAKVEDDLARGDTADLANDSQKLTDAVNAAVSSGALNGQQAALILLPAEEAQVGAGVVSGSSNAGSLEDLFQKYCQTNNLSTDADHVVSSWSQFIGELQSSFPGMRSPAAQSTIHAAEMGVYQTTLQQGVTTGSTQFQSGWSVGGDTYSGSAQVNTNVGNSWGQSTGSATTTGTTQFQLPPPGGDTYSGSAQVNFGAGWQVYSPST